MSEFKLPSKAKVGIYDGDPCVCRPGIALVLVNGAWVDNPGAFWEGTVMPFADWLSEFPDLPPIPKEDFHFMDKADIAAE